MVSSVGPRFISSLLLLPRRQHTHVPGLQLQGKQGMGEWKAGTAGFRHQSCASRAAATSMFHGLGEVRDSQTLLLTASNRQVGASDAQA